MKAAFTLSLFTSPLLDNVLDQLQGSDSVWVTTSAASGHALFRGRRDGGVERKGRGKSDASWDRSHVHRGRWSAWRVWTSPPPMDRTTTSPWTRPPPPPTKERLLTYQYLLQEGKVIDLPAPSPNIWELCADGQYASYWNAFLVKLY